MQASLRALAGGLALALALCTAAFAAATTISESGSTLLLPLMDRWTQAYESSHGDISITTSGTGSGAGIADAIAGRSAIGASDAYMSDSAMQATPMIHVPLAIGAQQINYNIPEIRGQHLHLDAAALARIYSGSVSMWDDWHIKALNPSIATRLPHHAIVPIRRSDASGDTFLFTQYLSDGDPMWKKNVGFGTSVNWPSVDRVQTAKGNADVVNLCASAPYSIAYVGISFFDRASNAGLDYAALRGAAGDFVLPTADSIRAAVAAVDDRVPADARVSLINAKVTGAYPIVNLEYAVIRGRQPDPATAAALRSFLTWIISPAGGQQAQLMEGLHLQPLNETFERIAQRQIAQIH